jgi:hypothetical protein
VKRAMSCIDSDPTSSHTFILHDLEKAPTDLITIPEFHAHSEAAHLVSEEATLHQQVLKDDYTIPPLCTWDNEWSPLHMEMWGNVTWGEEMEMVYESGQLEQEGQGDEMM